MPLLFIKFGFFDVLDILIVAFIFYQVYRLVKGTAAINIFAGIFIFYLAWLLVRAFHMELISSILGQFMGMGVIALLIVFQQEVRCFLLLLGSKYNLQNIFNLESFLAKPEIKEDVSEAIAEACGRFTASYTGALIVFAQNTELFTYAQTGVILRAQVTDELIENIFFKIHLCMTGLSLLPTIKFWPPVVSFRFPIVWTFPEVWVCATGLPWD